MRLNKRTVLVIDEAAMADTPLLSGVIEKAEKEGALTVLIGDDKQCQAIGHGGAFVVAQRLLGSVNLTENHRQRQDADRQVVAHLIAGEGDKALRALVVNNRVTVEADGENAIGRLVTDWSTQGITDPAENIIFVSTHAERLKVNQACQRRRLKFFQSVLRAFTVNEDGERLYAGDRVQFRETINVTQPQNGLADLAKDALRATWNLRKSIRFETIRRGTTGSVLSINPLNDSLRVGLDDGRVLEVPMDIERSVDPSKPTGKQQKGRAAIALGYAQTTHAGQGGTYENVFCLATTPSMQTRELSLVQMSRAKNTTRLYTTRSLAGLEVSLLSDVRSSRDLADDQEVARLERELECARRFPENLGR